jgi:hypothetical protein
MKAPRKKRLDTLFLAIGEVTVTLAYLELYIDMCIDAIFLHWGGRDLGIEPPRTSFSRKIAFMREWLKQHPDAARVFPTLPEELTAISDGADFRHSLVHSIVVDMEQYEVSGIVTIFNVRRNKQRVVNKSRTAKTKIKQIREYRNQILRFAFFFAALHNRLKLGLSADDKPV